MPSKTKTVFGFERLATSCEAAMGGWLLSFCGVTAGDGKFSGIPDLGASDAGLGALSRFVATTTVSIIDRKSVV